MWCFWALAEANSISGWKRYSSATLPSKLESSGVLKARNLSAIMRVDLRGQCSQRAGSGPGSEPPPRSPWPRLRFIVLPWKSFTHSGSMLVEVWKRAKWFWFKWALTVGKKLSQHKCGIEKFPRVFLWKKGKFRERSISSEQVSFLRKSRHLLSWPAAVVDPVSACLVDAAN